MVDKFNLLWLYSIVMHTLIDKKQTNILHALGFVNMTGVPIIRGDKVVSRVTGQGRSSRGKWGKVSDFTIIVSLAGDVYMRYGNSDVTTGELFIQLCSSMILSEAGESIFLDLIPPIGHHYDLGELWSRLLPENGAY